MGRNKNEVSTKSLHPTAFWLMFIGAIAGLAYTVYEAIDVIVIWTAVTGVYSGIFAFVNMLADMQGADTIMMIVLYGVGGILLLIYTIFILIYIVFILRLMKNKAGPTKQRYFRGVFNLSVISAIIALLGIVGGEWINLISLAVNVIVIVGIKMQEGYTPADEKQVDEQI